MPSSTPTFFQFESDFVQSLRCIPMQVRYKLDLCGIKLKLEHWHQFSTAEREALVAAPCDTESQKEQYRQHLQALITRNGRSPAKDIPIDPHPPWEQIDTIPEAVQTQAQQCNTAISVARWAGLTPLQRFALCKLSRPGHENRNFLPALCELGLID